MRQSIPLSSINSCASVSVTMPSLACGPTNRPRSKRLANRHSPWPSQNRTLCRSPRRSRKTNRWQLNRPCPSICCTWRSRPSKPRRMSVVRAASQTRVPAEGEITRAEALGSGAAPCSRCAGPHSRCTGSAAGSRRGVRCEQFPPRRRGRIPVLRRNLNGDQPSRGRENLCAPTPSRRQRHSRLEQTT